MARPGAASQTLMSIKLPGDLVEMQISDSIGLGRGWEGGNYS